MSTSSVLRKEDGDTYVLDTKYYGKYRFSAAATLASADAASAEVYAAERTDGQSPHLVALKFDTGSQVYSDHLYWSELYHSSALFPGLPWILQNNIPEVLWHDRRVDILVSERLGASLEATRLRNASGALPPRTVCCVAVQALDMLAAMHAAGVVHRDIKPANLLLPLESKPPQQLHIIDFGISCKIGARGAEAGQNADGTALFSHRGAARRHPVTFRDDLEALGYTLLALAAGALPWEGLARQTVAKKAAAKHAEDVAKAKAARLADGIAAVRAAPLARALTAYFAALRLQVRGDNAARFEYAPLRALFAGAYAELAGKPYAHGLDWEAGAGDAARADSASPMERKRKHDAAAPEATPAVVADAKTRPTKKRRQAAATAAAAVTPTRRSARLGGAKKPASPPPQSPPPRRRR